MRIKWRQSITDGRWYNNKVKSLTIQYVDNSTYDIVKGVTLIAKEYSEHKAKIRANNFIRTWMSQSELAQAATEFLSDIDPTRS